MTDELRAAAERLRVIKAGAPNPGYGHPYEYQHPSGGWYVDRAKIVVDQLLIVDAWLHEHPADDAEPVTDGWLESIGFEEIDCPRHGCRNAFSDKCRHVIFSPHWHRDFVGQWFVNGLMCQEKKTRGDVRRLCAALGIKLAEEDGR